MRRFTWLIVGFALAIALPLAYFAWQTYQGLKREDMATLQYFSQAMFDRMETVLDDLVSEEEKRAVDEYRFEVIQPNTQIRQPSPLSRLPSADYILGYLQNNPDGSFQTPLVENLEAVPGAYVQHVSELKQINQVFNTQRRTIAGQRTPAPIPEAAPSPQTKPQKASPRLAQRYLEETKAGVKQRLGQQQDRVANITAEQVSNLAFSPPPARKLSEDFEAGHDPAEKRETETGKKRDLFSRSKSIAKSSTGRPAGEGQIAALADKVQAARAGRGYRIEVAPLQPIWIDSERLFLFRRIQLDREIYRQGVILRVSALMAHLAENHFAVQPMAKYTGLRLSAAITDSAPKTLVHGQLDGPYKFTTQRRFPAPFDFLEAQVVCREVPPLQDRRFMNGMWLLLVVVVAVGLTTLYHGARTITDMAERRSKFVSSVTHELKTPITNIRMYVEMLEQGMADTPEKEQAYYGTLNTETRRLSHLIQNVLELSRLENKRRGLRMISGHLSQPLQDLAQIMAEPLEKAGFQLILKPAAIAPTAYDPEVVLHILTNLVENSIKFGHDQPLRQITVGTRPAIAATELYVCDSGPGIPRQALKKIFEDFYRAQDPMTARTRGTGIGLALVRRFAVAMGGRVAARNNPDRGCTISIFLPLSNPAET